MSRSIAEKLLDCIGQIEEFFIDEAEKAGTAGAKTAKRKRIVKYSAYSAVGVAVTVGVIAGFWKLRSSRVAKSAYTGSVRVGS